MLCGSTERMHRMAYYEVHRDGYRISCDPAGIDVDAVHAFLSRSYWAEGIPRELVAQSIEGSLCFGLFAAAQQIGFARVITDRATFGYLADVYVLESHRGRGLGRWLMQVLMAHPDLQRLRRFVLVTRDAHELYRPFGFGPIQHVERYMEITRPGMYRAAAGAAVQSSS